MQLRPMQCPWQSSFLLTTLACHFPQIDPKPCTPRGMQPERTRPKEGWVRSSVMLVGGYHYPTLLTDLREMSWVGAGAIESQAPSPWTGCAIVLIRPLPSGACHLSSCSVVGGARCAPGVVRAPLHTSAVPAWQRAMPSLPRVPAGTLVSWPQPLKCWDASWKLLFPNCFPNVFVFFCSCVFVCLGTA